MLTITVDSRVRVPLEAVAPETADALKAAFEHANPGWPDSGPATERTWHQDGPDLALPRGGMGRVRAILGAAGGPWRAEDGRTAGDYSLLDDSWGLFGSIPKHRLELWDFQERMVDGILRRQNCIVEASTGTGKTSAALAAIARIGRPAIVVVNTGGLMEQWVRRVVAELGVEEERVGIIGDGKRRTAPVTIAMQQTLARGIEPKWLAAFGVLIADEMDLFSADTYFASADPWPAKYRVGMTATVKRHDRREYLVRDLFGEVVAEVTREEAVAKGRIVEVEVRVVPTNFRADWYRAAAASDNKFRLFAAHKKLLEAMWKDDGRNALVREIVEDEVGGGAQVMVLSARRDHCTLLDAQLSARGIRSGIMLGGAEAKAEFKRTRDALHKGTKQVVIGTYKAIGRGQDFPAVAVGVATMPIAKNKTEVAQVVGRLCRACEAEGKTGGRLYVLVDVAVSGRRPVENLAKWNRRCVVRAPGGEWVDAGEWLRGIKGQVRANARTTAGELGGR